MKKIFKVLTALIMMVSVVNLTGCSEDSKAKVVRIGTMNLINGDLIVQQEKWYENELGIKARITYFDSVRNVRAAVEEGSIDIAQLGSSPAAIMIADNLNVEVFWIGAVLGTAESLVVKKDAGIDSVKDLIGKRIGTPFSSTSHYSLMRALELENVDTSRVQIFDLQPDEILDAWNRNDIDAAYVWYPVLEDLFANNGIAVTNSYQLARKGIVTADVNIVQRSFGQNNPEVVTKFVELQLRANDMIKNDHDRAVKDISTLLSITDNVSEMLLMQYEYLDADEEIDYLDNRMPQILKSTADFLVTQGTIPNSPPLESFKFGVNSEYVKSAVENMR